MIVIIDNYDLFTYNLAQYIGELGAEVQVFRNDAVTPDEVEALQPSHIVISPGPGEPSDAGISRDVIRQLGTADTHPGCLPRSPVHRRSLRWESCPGTSVDARQDLAHPAQRRSALQRHSRSLRSHPLPLTDRRAGKLPG